MTTKDNFNSHRLATEVCNLMWNHPDIDSSSPGARSRIIQLVFERATEMMVAKARKLEQGP